MERSVPGAALVVFVLAFPQGGVGQEFRFLLEVEGHESGDTITGPAGHQIVLDAKVVLDAFEEGVQAYSVAVGVDGADADLRLPPCDDGKCWARLLFPLGDGDEVFLADGRSVDPDFVPSVGPLAGHRQGPGVWAGIALSPLKKPPSMLPAGRTDLLRFEVALTIPDGAEEVRIVDKDGLDEIYTNTVVWRTNTVLPTIENFTLTLRPGIVFRRADSNSDGQIDISDAIHTLRVLFVEEGEIRCEDAADANDDGQLDISDPIITLGKLFLGDEEIPAPGIEACGPDPTDDPAEDRLNCDSYAAYASCSW